MITLDLDNRRANIQSYKAKNIDIANKDYSRKEAEINSGRNLQVVLVSSESIKSLRKSYPNYFLDTEIFSSKIETIRKKLKKMGQAYIPTNNIPRS